jgi:hypothetical protein
MGGIFSIFSSNKAEKKPEQTNQNIGGTYNYRPEYQASSSSYKPTQASVTQTTQKQPPSYTAEAVSYPRTISSSKAENYGSKEINQYSYSYSRPQETNY